MVSVAAMEITFTSMTGMAMTMKKLPTGNVMPCYSYLHEQSPLFGLVGIQPAYPIYVSTILTGLGTRLFRQVNHPICEASFCSQPNEDTYLVCRKFPFMFKIAEEIKHIQTLLFRSNVFSVFSPSPSSHSEYPGGRPWSVGFARVSGLAVLVLNKRENTEIYTRSKYTTV
jgi:hypothetical protein